MDLRSTQPLTEMSTRNLPGGKGRPARKADNLNAVCVSSISKIWEPRRLTTLWASMVFDSDRFTFFIPLSCICCAVGLRKFWISGSTKKYGALACTRVNGKPVRNFCSMCLRMRTASGWTIASHFRVSREKCVISYDATDSKFWRWVTVKGSPSRKWKDVLSLVLGRRDSDMFFILKLN
jgi:hypothetical protein